MNYHTAFEEFKQSFESYLSGSEETPEKMLFLRYEAPAHLPGSSSTETDWEDYLKLLDECQDYAMRRNVTSNYVFFDADKYARWCAGQDVEDTLENRARWARTQLQEEVATHTSDPITWFIITGHPNWYKVSPAQL